MRKNESLNEAEAHDQDEPSAQQDVAEEPQPARPHRLLRVQARHAEHPENGHRAGDDVHGLPSRCGDRCRDVCRMEDSHQHVTHSREQRRQSR